ncbi:thermonuclease family protein [Sulfuricurvum sp.]|uniref:thermonuclease family protein n=1 Tax=Sulfuricurvum sp. TaxID=2025608 RepID=UPI002631D9A3|nr:thermonuclease family protein [Sulfuricurvum sp.]MDD2267893.1 thermonuclease family protein [Sulfuricurvum sp.]
MLKKIMICAALAAQIQAGTLDGIVVAVTDGDTLKMLTNDKREIKIRLAKIDAPEKSQAFGQASKKALSDICYKQHLHVEIETIDRYGRTVGTVTCKGIEANLEQIKNGMAWVYVKYTKDQKYIEAEKKAKEEKAGLWKEPTATPPWEFRRNAHTLSEQPKS